MRLGQRLSDESRHAHGIAAGQLCAGDQFREGFAFDELHRDVHHFVLGVDGVDRGDVRMVELRGGARFTEESDLRLLVRRDALGENFHRHRPEQTRVFGLPYLSHSARADARKETIVAELRGSHLDVRGG